MPCDQAAGETPCRRASDHLVWGFVQGGRLRLSLMGVLECASGQIKRQLEEARISRCGRRRRIRCQGLGEVAVGSVSTLIGLVRAWRRKGWDASADLAIGAVAPFVSSQTIA